MIRSRKQFKSGRATNERAEHRANEISLAHSTRTVADFTKALVLVGILSAIVSGLQWNEMRSSGPQTQKLVSSNADLAEASKTQAKTASDALIASERAWVGSIDASIVKSAIGTPIKGIVSYVNSGREPAKTQTEAAGYIYDRSEWDDGAAGIAIIQHQDTCIAKRSIEGLRFAWPTTGFNSYTIQIAGRSAPEIGATVWSDRINSGDDIMAVQGCLTYEAFGAIHHTAFCYFYDGRTTDVTHLNICQIGNKVD